MSAALCYISIQHQQFGPAALREGLIAIHFRIMALEEKLK